MTRQRMIDKAVRRWKHCYIPWAPWKHNTLFVRLVRDEFARIAKAQ